MNLIIGNKRYSSWSLRPWLTLRQAEIPFRETLVLIHRKDSLKNILKFSPAGRVPVLIDGKTTVWESLAICEYLADCYPQKKLWPVKAADRAKARAISNEMHAGFTALRQNLPMDCCLRTRLKKLKPEVKADVARISEIWNDCLKKSGGPFLFGHFTIADAMFAPVVMRFEVYGIRTDKKCSAYQKRTLNLPALREWADAALDEPEMDVH